MLEIHTLHFNGILKNSSQVFFYNFYSLVVLHFKLLRYLKFPVVFLRPFRRKGEFIQQDTRLQTNGGREVLKKIYGREAGR